MSEHSIPLEVDAAPEDHKATYDGTWQNARMGIMLVFFAMLGVIYVFANSMAAVATGVIFAMGIFKFVGGRWISAIAWGVASVILFAIVAGVKSFIVGMI